MQRLNTTTSEVRSATREAQQATDSFRAAREAMEQLAKRTATRMQAVKKRFVAADGRVTEELTVALRELGCLLDTTSREQTPREVLVQVLTGARTALDEILREVQP
jgi:hypothetical protein